MASSLPERRRLEQRGQRHTGSEDDPFLPRRTANFRPLFLFADTSRIYAYRTPDSPEDSTRSSPRTASGS